MAPDFFLTETMYRLRLMDRALGAHKSAVEVVSSRGTSIASFPIYWERHPFLSTVPNRVTLAQRPVRVFLRCPDDAVEFVRVVSAPPGIRAVVAGERELLVRVEDGYAGSVNGAIEAAVNRNDAIVRIPVVRYVGRRG